MDKTAITSGLKYVNIAIGQKQHGLLYTCDQYIYTASDSSDVRDITGVLIFTMKIAPDIFICSQ